MKQISILTIRLAAAGLAAALAVTPVLAEDLTAGKTAAQLFRTDCATCHHSPNGLVRQRGDVGELTAFLMEHYTTKPGTAAALAAYVSGFASNRGPGRDRPRSRSDGDAPATTTNGDTPSDMRPSDTRSADELPPPRRQPGGTAGGNRRRTHDNGGAPRTGGPDRPAATTPPAASDPPAHSDETRGGGDAQDGDTHDGDDPIARLRSYLSSGLDAENAGKEAGKDPGKDADRTAEAPRVRKRHPAADAPQAQHGDQEGDRPDGAAEEPPPQSGAAETAR